MRVYDGGLFFFTMLFTLAAVGYGSKYLIQSKHHTGRDEFKGHDNFVEEIVEDLIEKQVGLPEGSIDLSPQSSEKPL